MDLTRGIDAATLAAMAGHFHPVIAVELDWPGDPVYVHSGTGEIIWDGKTFLGVGDFGDVNIPGDTIGSVPTEAVLTLLGVPPEIFDRLDDPIRNRYGAIYFGCLTEPGGNTLVGDLTILFEGYMDASSYTGERNGEVITHGIQITLGTGGGMRSTANITHSYEAQIAEYPGDTAGRHLQWAVKQAKKRKWPE